MIIEKFKAGKIKEVYKRAEEKGRMLPDGLQYVNSWVTEDLSMCYQIMETDDINKLHEWIRKWNDLVDFEVHRVITSAAAKEKVTLL